VVFVLLFLWKIESNIFLFPQKGFARYNYAYMKRGFTLIELMVVVAIATILTTVVIASTSGSRAKSRDLRRQADIREIQLALELYKDVNRVYPVTGDGATGGTNWQAVLVSGGYLSQVVVPPTPPTGEGYRYESVGGSNKHYCLGVVVEGSPTSLEAHDTTRCTSAPFTPASVFKVYK
jgi:prepilin-type N-terminal cleavage/methylation domain-containing protein